MNAPKPPPPPSVRDGQLQFRRQGLRATPWQDLYSRILGSSWATYLLALAGIYLGTNTLFALLYLAGGDCIGARDPSSFLLAFSFSVQTMSTIGYGAMSPTTPYAHVLVALESFLGLLGVALATGISFAKVARPQARVAFARHAVVATRNGRPCLMFRMANERNYSRIVDARLSVYALIDEVTEEGEFMRRFHEIRLERDRSPLFLMSWTAMHFVDGDSPLVGAEGLNPKLRALVVTLSGIEDAYMSTVHAQHYYVPDDIVLGHRYVDMITTIDGLVALDHERLHDTVPEDV